MLKCVALKAQSSFLPLSSLLLRKASTSQPKERWDLVAAVCLERRPCLTPRLGQTEQAMVDLLDTKEIEDSLLCDHELLAKADLEREEKKRAGENLEGEEEGIITAFDMEDSWKKGAVTFQPASRLTEADTSNNVHSVDRLLDTHLRLVTKLQLGKDLHWALPWTIRLDGETMREAAERGLRERCGQQLQEQAMLLGNAPGSFYKYTYPKHYSEKMGGVRGAKVFIYKGFLKHQISKEPGVEVKAPVEDFQWATLAEMEELLDRKTFRAIEEMSMPED